IVHNQQDIVLLTQLGQTFQPFGTGRVQTAFALNRLNDHGCRQLNTGGTIRQHFVHDGQGIDILTQVAVVEHEVDMTQGYAHTTTMVFVTSRSNGTGRYTVKNVGEGNRSEERRVGKE